jgi:hypothetical protein
MHTHITYVPTHTHIPTCKYVGKNRKKKLLAELKACFPAVYIYIYIYIFIVLRVYYYYLFFVKKFLLKNSVYVQFFGYNLNNSHSRQVCNIYLQTISWQHVRMFMTHVGTKVYMPNSSTSLVISIKAQKQRKINYALPPCCYFTLCKILHSQTNMFFHDMSPCIISGPQSKFRYCLSHLQSSFVRHVVITCSVEG